jgi:shikimate kinase
MAEKKIILIGFMGTGKSTVGQKVAEVLFIPHIDTDDWMETKSGIDIPALVISDIAQFRKLEAEALLTILSESSGVISTGGGIVSTEAGRNTLLNANIPVVWLKTPFELAQKRILQDTGRERPLFSDITKARALHDELARWYARTATHTIDASQPLDQIVTQVIRIART